MENKKTKNKFSAKKAIIITLISVTVLVLLIFAIICISSAYSFTHPKKIVADRFPDDNDIRLSYESTTVRFSSGDETVLWFIPCQNTKTGEKEHSDVTVIFSHDYGDNKTARLSEDGVLYAKDLVKEGYNVVLFDYSGSGIATGNGYTFGSREAEELKEIISYVKENYNSDKIILHGWGFGASAAIMAGADNEDVTAVIAESPYADLKEYFTNDRGVEIWTGLPKFLADGVRILIPPFAGRDIYSGGPKEVLSHPTEQKYMFIGSELDNVFGKDCIKDLTSYAQGHENDVNLWICENSPHAQGYRTRKDEYVVRVRNFINEACGIKQEVPEKPEKNN